MMNTGHLDIQNRKQVNPLLNSNNGAATETDSKIDTGSTTEGAIGVVNAKQTEGFRAASRPSHSKIARDGSLQKSTGLTGSGTQTYAGIQNENNDIVMHSDTLGNYLQGHLHSQPQHLRGPPSQDDHKKEGVASSRPANLNHEELDILHNFLQRQTTKRHDELDDDVIAVRMVRTDQLAKERVSLMADPEADSEEEESRIVQAVAYRDQMDFIMRQEFFKQVTHDANTSNFDAKTMYWLKKRMGLQRKKEVTNLVGRGGTRSQDPSGESDYDDEQDSSQPRGATKARRLTRGMARHTRIKKREERQSAKESWGLRSLLAAVEDFEVKELLASSPSSEIQRQIHPNNKKKQAPKVSNKKRSTKRPHNGGIVTDPDMDLSGFVPVSKWLSESERAKMGVDRKFEIKVSSIIIGGNNLEPIMRFVFKDDEESRAIRHRLPKTSKRPRLFQPSPETETSLFETPLEASTETSIEPPMILPTKQKSRKRKKRGAARGGVEKIALGNVPLSLGLLEWRRRQQYATSKENSDDSSSEDDELECAMRVSMNLEEAGIETRLPRWETVNPFSEMMRQPPMTDPPRTAHTDRRYASWCSKLIRCLNGNGRSFARHEFFYSDIDRPWFNFDGFRVDLARLGIPPDAKFSRREWSVIRQEIRKRPRRFSQNFVKEELRKLMEYRATVRCLQHIDLPRPEGFPFEVPRPIDVGTTVTAFNKRLRLLHRGVVLAYDLNRCAYLVQFERKELGLRFCADTEVASHGIPEMLYPSESVALDGTATGGFAERNESLGALDIGTCYAPVERVRRDRKKGIAIGKVNGAAGVFKSSARELSHSELLEKCAEREILVKLTEAIELCIQRKSLLLDAMEDFHKIAARRGRDLPSKEFTEHYAWLLGNLDITSKSLDALSVHLQVMYSKSLDETKLAKAELNRDCHESKALEQIEATLHFPDRVNSNVFSPWISALLVQAGNNSGGVDVNRSSASFAEQQRHKFFDSRLANARKLLLCAEYTSNYKRPISDAITMSNAIETILETNMNDLESPDMNVPGLREADAQREIAMNELRDAVGNFHEELAALHSRQLPTRE